MAGSAAQTGGTAHDDVECHASDRFQVVARTGEGGLGTDFTVRARTAPEAPLPCTGAPRPGDWEIPNEWAEYFLALQDRWLILDNGTGPDARGLVVWDLDERRKVYEDTYFDLAGGGDGVVEYWTRGGEATEENCPALRGWEVQGLGAEMERRVRLELAALTLHETGETRCGARQ